MVHKPPVAAAVAGEVIHLPSLLAFESVARHLSFSRAATALQVTPTAISKTIRQLEAQLGVRLFNRTTRSVALSEPGVRLLESLVPAISQIRHALTHVSDTYTKPFGLLRINTSWVAHASLIEPHLPAFLARFPDINVEIALDNGLSDIVAAGFDAGIRLGHSLHRDMVAVPIGPVQQRLVVAAPEYLAAHPVPRTPQDLLAHACIRQRLPGSGRLFDWDFLVGRRVTRVDVSGRLIVDEMGAVLDAARRGCGFGYVFAQFAAADITAGRLVTVLEKYSPPTEPFYLYYPARTMMPGKLRAFLEFVRAATWTP